MRPTGRPAEDVAGADLSGFVLVGGNSSRMGRDKALLPIGSVPMAAYIASVVKQIATSVFLVGRPEIYSSLGFPVLPDRYPGFGPVGAIATALSATTSQWNIVLACDLPGVTNDVLLTIYSEAVASGSVCAYAAGPDRREQPLCGVYHRSALSAFERAVREGEHRLTQVTSRLRPHVLHLNDFETLRNVNTPEDWPVALNR
jgi:molybdopterin-guanine dinucleotide biosynthesis protein A